MRRIASMCLLFVGLLPLRAEDAAPTEEVRLTISCTDGCVLCGTATDSALRLQSQYGPLSLQVLWVKRIDVTKQGEKARLQMGNGDLLHGTIEQCVVGIQTIVGRLSVPLKCIRRIDVHGTKGGALIANQWIWLDENGKRIKGADRVRRPHWKTTVEYYAVPD